MFPAEVVPSESPGYVLANAGLFDDALSMIYELGLGKAAQVKIPIKGEKISTTVQFTATLPKVEYEQLLNCFAGLIGSAEEHPSADLSKASQKN